jgi:hypothetical protein
MEQLIKIFTAFKPDITPSSIHPYGSGHINDTYLVQVDDSRDQRFILQRINHHIFKNVEGMMANIRKVTEHILSLPSEQSGNEIVIPEFYPDQHGNYIFLDRGGHYWRLGRFVSGSRSYDRITSPELAYEGGRAFGTFVKLTSAIDPGSLVETLPHFHRLSMRLDAFRHVVEADPAKRAASCDREIGFVGQRAESLLMLEKMLDLKQLPLRVTHNDTKINNVLFNLKNKAIAVVDLDTVMPGTLLVDFGDAIRTGACTSEEDEPDLTNTDIDVALFEAYAAGYLHAAGSVMVPAEKELLTFSARVMTFIIGLRFLTDHINGDQYYKTKYPGHNLVRARVQFRLLECMEEKSDIMEMIIKKIK